MKKKNIILLTSVLGLLVILISVYGFTYAKYVSNSILDYYLKSKGFYFNSDYLSLNNEKNVNNFWTGESVTFNVRNNLNKLVITDYDIDYKVTCTIKGEVPAGTSCRVNGTNSNIYEGVLSSFQVCVNEKNDGVDVSLFNKENCEIGGYSWENQIANQNLYFDIVSDEDVTDITANIEVSSTSPYHKKISGDFILHKANTSNGSINLGYKNYASYDRLIVSNSYSEDKCTTIIWNSSDLKIEVDSTQVLSYETDSNGYVNKIKVRIPAKNSLSYIFYKSDLNRIFDVSAFSYQEEDEC